MNTNTQPQHAVGQGRPQFLKLISNSTSTTLGIVLAAVVLLVPCANAATNLVTADRNFILAAAQGGILEVKLGALAAQNAQRDDVKAFGRMMVSDHMAINANLKVLAMFEGVTLPESLDAKHQAVMDTMTALTGSQFDDAYIKCMIKVHTKDARAFKAESAATNDGKIKTFADKSIPVVEEHLKQVTAMKK